MPSPPRRRPRLLPPFPTRTPDDPPPVSYEPTNLSPLPPGTCYDTSESPIPIFHTPDTDHHDPDPSSTHTSENSYYCVTYTLHPSHMDPTTYHTTPTGPHPTPMLDSQESITSTLGLLSTASERFDGPVRTTTILEPFTPEPPDQHPTKPPTVLTPCCQIPVLANQENVR